MYGRNRYGTTRYGSSVVPGGTTYLKTVATAVVTVVGSVGRSGFYSKVIALAQAIVSGGMSRKIGKHADGLVEATGGVKRFTRKSVASALATVVGSVTRSNVFLKVVALAQAIVTGNLSKQAGKIVDPGGVVVTGDLSKQAGKNVEGLVVVTGSLSRSIGKLVSGLVSVTGSARRFTRKSVATALATVVGSVGRSNLFHKAIAGIVSVIGSVVRSHKKAPNGGVTVTGSVSRKVFKNVVGQVDVVGSVDTDLFDIGYTMNMSPRQIFAKVRITYTDPFFAAGVESSATETGEGTDPAQTHDNVETTAFPWASLHRNDLTGTYHPMPSSGSPSVGWWSATLSDAVTRVFASPPVLTLEFAARGIETLKLVGDDALDEYAEDFTIRMYSEGDVLEYTKAVTGNTEVYWEFDNPDQTGIVKITLEVEKWSRASAVAKIAQFFTTLEETYLSEDGEVMSVRLEEETEYEGETIPQGNISSNRLTVRLNNIDDRFSPANTASPLYGKLLNNRAIQAWLGADVYPSGVRQWWSLGVFYTRDWDSPEQEAWAEVVSLDMLDRLARSEFTTSEVYENDTLADLAELVMTDAGLTSADWMIGSGLSSIAVPYAWFDRMTHREALRRIAAGALGQVFCDRDGKVNIDVYQSTVASVHDFKFTRSNFFEIEHPLKWSEMINEVRANAEPRVPGSEIDVCTDVEEFTVAGLGTTSRTHFFDTVPVVDVQDPLITGGANITLQSVTKYAWGAVVVYANSDAGDEVVTLITIAGKPLDVQGKKNATSEDASSISVNGRQTLPSPVTSEFWQTFDRASEVADALLESYKDPRRDVNIMARGNIGLVLGDRVVAPDYIDEVVGEFALQRQDLFFDGGLRVRYDGLRFGFVDYREEVAGQVVVSGVVGRKIFKNIRGQVVVSGGVARDATLINIEATSGSGFVQNFGANFTTVHSAAVGSAVFGGTAVLYSEMSNVGSSIVVRRASLVLASGDQIGGGETILTASIWVYITNVLASADFDLVVQDGQPTYPSDPMVVGDYDKTHYSGDGGSLARDDMVEDAWNEIVLNATGIGWIQKGAGNKTKLMLRTSLDIAGTPPGSTTETGVIFGEDTEGVVPYMRWTV